MPAETALGHPPFHFPDGRPAQSLEDQFRGRSAVLICGGPSFLEVDHSVIRGSGLVTMTLNNGVKTFRSDLWLGVDSPGKFDRTIWKDGCITKFVPRRAAAHRSARDGVGVFMYDRSSAWCAEQIFDSGNTIEWFNARGGGARTSMVDAIRVLFVLGFRTIYLFGVDFHQSKGYGYHHAASGYRFRIAGNNRIYRHLAVRFALMRPLMEAAGLYVYNCNPESRLEAFEKRPFDLTGDHARATP